MATNRVRHKPHKRQIMLVEDDQYLGGEVSRQMMDRGHNVVWASSAEEAMRLLQDTIFIGSKFDALLANYHLSDSSSLRVIRDFRNEFRGAQVGLMAHQNDIATAIWARSKGIPVLDRPLRADDLSNWLGSIEIVKTAAAS